MEQNQKPKAQLMNGDAMHRALKRMSHEILEQNEGAENIVLLGIRRRGVPLAQEIAGNIKEIEGSDVPIGELDITLYRDDLEEMSVAPTINETRVDFSVKNRIVVLVDDVIYTGRTVRAALDAVSAAFEFQAGIGAAALYDAADLFDAAELCFAEIGHGHAPALPVGVHGIHAVKAVGEEGGFLAAHAAADLEDDVFFVVGIGGEQQGLQPQLRLRQGGFSLRELFAGKLAQLFIVLLYREPGVVDALFQLFHPAPGLHHRLKILLLADGGRVGVDIAVDGRIVHPGREFFVFVLDPGQLLVHGQAPLRRLQDRGRGAPVGAAPALIDGFIAEDIKIAGVTMDIMRKALDQAKRGRNHILDIMEKCINKPQAISAYAPKIESLKIPVDKIGALIGPGGKNVKTLCSQYGVTINTDDDGTVTIYGKTGKSTDAAKAAVRAICEDPEPGTIYTGTVKRIMDFGAFVEILPGKEGLCHISKLSRSRVEKVSDVLKEGQVIPVKLLEVDKMGRLNLSYIDAIEAQAK